MRSSGTRPTSTACWPALPRSITQELNSVLHEYTFEATYSKPGYSGNTILDQPEANILLSAAIKACDAKTGLILDDRACEQRFDLSSVQCSASLTTNCLTATQYASATSGPSGRRRRRRPDRRVPRRRR